MRRATAVLAALVVAALALAGCGAAVPAAPAAPQRTAPAVAAAAARPARDLDSAAAPDAVMPTVRAPARHLERTYRAPAAQVDPGAGGVLRIAALGIRAPVDRVGLDGSAMAVPDDPRRVGWLRTTAAAGDAIGASVVSGHVSDRSDRLGALGRLRRIRIGTVVRWTTATGKQARFVVVAIHRYPRARGLPARLFRVDGGHVLHLITCADRTTTPGGGFHYRSNLVVTARAVAR